MIEKNKIETAVLLYLVATPIGNLEDISIRALNTLKKVDYIAAEDTRHTGMLLKHFEIKKPLISYHEHNFQRSGEQLIALLQEGKQIALVSDAGMPGISDPGRQLLCSAIALGIPYTVIPGASAGLTALVYSGLSTDRFVFEGFLPVKGKDRKKLLQEISSETRTVVLYEAPHRIRKTLTDLSDFLGEDRTLVLVRELTKIYEEAIRGTVFELLTWAESWQVKGELVLLIEGKKETSIAIPSKQQLQQEIDVLLQQGASKKEATKKIADRYSLRRQELYLLQEEKS